MKIIDLAIMAQFRMKSLCEFCGCYARQIEVHHCFGRGHGGGTRIDHPYNLIALCGAYDRDCHGRAQRYVIKRSSILAVISKREDVPVADLVDFIYRARRAAKGSVVS